jgi:hypothetical protein
MDEMETLTMSSKELNRLEVLGRVLGVGWIWIQLI